MATCPKCLKRYDDDVKVCEQDGLALLPDEACANLDERLEPGATVGDYVIDDQIGDGGYGVVYSATHPLIGKRVAIKVLSRKCSSDPMIVSRFIAEARAVNEIRHRNIVDIFTFGMLKTGVHYFVMELLEGETIATHIKRDGPIAIEEALPILNRISRALGAAHEVGIAHRDLKPDNVFLVEPKDGPIEPRLLDFGVAKHFGEHAPSHLTETGAALGTPKYMSPEQCNGDEVDHRADIYAFGILTHEMLTGKPPFDAKRTLDLFLHHRTTPPPTMSSVNPQVPTVLDAPVLAMLEKKPDDRPASLRDAMIALEEAAFAMGLELSFSERQSLRGHTPSSQSSSSNKIVIVDSPSSEGEPLVAQERVSAKTAPSKDAPADSSPHSQTLVALGDVDSVAPRRTSAAVPAIAAIAVVGVIAGIYLVTSEGGRSQSAPSSAVDQAPAATAPATTARSTVPAATAQPTATSSAGPIAGPSAHRTAGPTPSQTTTPKTATTERPLSGHGQPKGKPGPTPKPKEPIHGDLPNNPFD